jgi:hypothetical protein
LRVFENRVLWNDSEQKEIKWQEDGENCLMRNFINYNLHQMTIRMIQLRRMIWLVYIARMGKIRNVYKILVEKSEGKTLLGKPRCKWENNIKWISMIETSGELL